MEEPGNLLCPYRSFVFYLSKVDKEKQLPAWSVFLNPQSSKFTDEFWFKKPFGKREKRNFFTNLKQVMKKHSDFDDWQGHYTNHSCRSSACTDMERGNLNSGVIRQKMDHRSIVSQDRYRDHRVGNMKAIGALQKRYRVDDSLAILPPSTSINQQNMDSTVSAFPSHSINQQVDIEYINLNTISDYELPEQSINVCDVPTVSSPIEANNTLQMQPQALTAQTKQKKQISICQSATGLGFNPYKRYQAKTDKIQYFSVLSGLLAIIGFNVKSHSMASHHY